MDFIFSFSSVGWVTCNFQQRGGFAKLFFPSIDSSRPAPATCYSSLIKSKQQRVKRLGVQNRLVTPAHPRWPNRFVYTSYLKSIWYRNFSRCRKLPVIGRISACRAPCNRRGVLVGRCSPGPDRKVDMTLGRWKDSLQMPVLMSHPY